jgi:hypothetical protein
VRDIVKILNFGKQLSVLVANVLLVIKTLLLIKVINFTVCIVCIFKRFVVCVGSGTA